MMKKRMMALVMCVAMAAGLMTGCGSKTETAAPAAPAATESKTEAAATDAAPETVSLVCWYQESDFQPIIDAVEEQLGGKYTIEYQYVNNTDYSSVVNTMLASGEGPDIVSGMDDFNAWMKAGYLVDLTGQPYLEGFSDASLATASFEGKNYGFSGYGWFCGMWYNIDLFEENGWEVPKSVDDYIELSKKCEEKGIELMSMGLADHDDFGHVYSAYISNSFYTNDEAENPAGFAWAQDFAYGRDTLSNGWANVTDEFFRLVEEGVYKPEWLGYTVDQTLAQFANGEIAMVHGGPWNYDFMQESGVNAGMCPHVSATGNATTLQGGFGVNFGINGNSKNQEAANAVMTALGSVEVQQVFVNTSPGSFSAKAGVVVEIPEVYSEVKPIIDAGSLYSVTSAWAINMPSQAMFDEMLSLGEGVVAGIIDREQFLKALDEKADSIRYE